ncbi:O-Glycosyl hydrolase family 30 [Gigaspora margarita]|uniref:O-Glycosyl hydrolase family 30 n=1 Tax=Gigaspora margarita TaxID=4874 RepID=A0A8H4AUF2_GIGMA|nr:O-Glycosyl hydrolase family 30 [Gigaspora margarita]
MRIGANVPGFWPCKTCDYNWTSDANQRWFLFAAKERGADIFEAFSNSPPYWMTNSGCSSGGQNFSDNLNSSYYDAHADYLTEVVRWYKEQGLIFRTLDPFNEPTFRHWRDYGSQEGCSYSCYAMKEIIKKVGAYLDKKDLSENTSISIADESTIDEEVSTISCIGEDAKSYISQYNTHAYWGIHRTQLYNIAKQDGKRLWMSEVYVIFAASIIFNKYYEIMLSCYLVECWNRGFISSKDMSTSIQLSEEILNDMRNLKPGAWVYWQAIEDDHNDWNDGWGLIGVNYSNSTTPLNKHLAFYGFAQYTKFIRPGYQIISSNDSDTLAAYDAGNKTLVLVCTNKNKMLNIWDINVSMFNIS